MLVLITYDVSTQSAAGKARLRKVARRVWTMGSASRIPYLSAFWMRPSYCG